MAEYDFVVHHVLEALRGGIAKLNGDEDLAQYLNAQTKLRLITMSYEELWQLAELFSPPLGRSVELSYKEIEQLVDEHRATASEWVNDLAKRTIPDKEREDAR